MSNGGRTLWAVFSCYGCGQPYHDHCPRLLCRAGWSFGRSPDRKLERDLIVGYEKDVATVLGLLSSITHDTAVELLSLPDRIRGYGPVKEKAVADAKVRYAQLAADLANPPPAPRQIAAE